MPKSPWTARARRRAALLWSIAGAVLVLALLLSLAAGLTGRAPAAQVRQTFTHASPAERALTITASTFGLTAQDQDAAVRAIGRAFGDAPIDVNHRTSAQSVTWTIEPDVSRLTPAELPALQHGFDTIGDTLSTVLADSGGVTAHGVAGATTATVRNTVQTVSETAVLPLGIIAIAGILAVGMLAQLLIAAREAEDRLLRSRGASAGRLIRVAAAEATLISVPASLLGAAAAQVALSVWIGPPASPGEVVTPWLVALVGAVAAVVVVAVPAATRPLGDPG
ncbi:MAG TPA: FtsX-like permease family protein, partial [Microbacterium sp.]|uniref:FtsX-like permease family protein n=1 Tax=Microbacterium sp. TaxID=51671 RepID=UPI002B49F14C